MMKQTINLVFIFTLLFCYLITAHAIPKVVPQAPAVDAQAYILMDHNSGKVLAEKNSDEKIPPASITKIMTAFVVFSELEEGNIQLDNMVTISEKAWRTQGSRMFIEVNNKVSVEKLLKGMIIQSGNDASVALAEFIAGSEDAFAALMNQHAAELGMKNTHFVNSTGLPDPEHKTSAADLAMLASALIRKYPEYYKWYSNKEFTYNNIKQHNRNKLLWRDDSVDGMKTGYTKEAGYCLVATANRDNMRLISIVLGTKSATARAQESQKLLNFGFRFYETHALYKAKKPLKMVRIYMGSKEQLSVGLAKDMYITIPRGQYKDLKPAIKIDSLIEAPVTRGRELGKVSVALNNELAAKAPLIALESISEGSLWQQAKDSVLLLIE